MQSNLGILVTTHDTSCCRARYKNLSQCFSTKHMGGKNSLRQHPKVCPGIEMNCKGNPLNPGTKCSSNSFVKIRICFALALVRIHLAHHQLGSQQGERGVIPSSEIPGIAQGSPYGASGSGEGWAFPEAALNGVEIGNVFPASRTLPACLLFSLRLTGWKVPREAARQALTADVM